MECCGSILFLLLLLGPHITCAQVYITARRRSYLPSYWSQMRRPHHLSKRVHKPQVKPTSISSTVATESNTQRDQYVRSLWRGVIAPRRRLTTTETQGRKPSTEIHNLDRNVKTMARSVPNPTPPTNSPFTRNSILDLDHTMEEEKIQMLALMTQASNGNVRAQQKISDIELARLNDYVGHNQQLSDMICQACSFFSDPTKCKLRFCADGFSNKTA